VKNTGLVRRKLSSCRRSRPITPSDAHVTYVTYVTYVTFVRRSRPITPSDALPEGCHLLALYEAAAAKTGSDAKIGSDTNEDGAEKGSDATDRGGEEEPASVRLYLDAVLLSGPDDVAAARAQPSAMAGA